VKSGGYNPTIISGTGFSGPRNRSVRLIRAVMVAHFIDDIVALMLSYALTYYLRFSRTVFSVLAGNSMFESSYARIYFNRAYLYFCVLAVCLFAFYSIMGMYEGHRRLRRTPIVWNSIIGNGAVLALMSVYLFFSKDNWHMRGFFPLVLLINIPFTVLMRVLTNFVISGLRIRYPSLCTSTLLLGSGADAEVIRQRASLGKLKGIRIYNQVPAFQSPKEMREKLPDLLTPKTDLVFLVDRNLSTNTIMEAVRICSERNKALKVLFPRFLTLYNPYSSGDMVDGIPIVHFSPPEFVNNDRKMRRYISVTIASVSAVVVAPLMFIISIAIRLNSPGKAIFRQNRYGKGGATFSMMKFRTMREGAESEIEQLREYNESDGALFKMHNDPRITRFGALLRRTSIDEIPQIINILRGEMRFIGPRPLPSSDLEDYKDSWHFMRQNCYPGISCVWQVAGRSDIGFEDMCLLDIWYWLNNNSMLDVRIFFRTLWVVFSRRGAY